MRLLWPFLAIVSSPLDRCPLLGGEAFRRRCRFQPLDSLFRMRVVVVAFDCGSLARLSVAEPLWERSFRGSERFAVEGPGTRWADMCWKCVVPVKVRGDSWSCWRAVNRMRDDGKRCGSRPHPLRYCFVMFRHSHVVVVASWEVAAHVKCDRALAALRPDKAHSRYLKTFLRSAGARNMFAAS